MKNFIPTVVTVKASSDLEKSIAQTLLDSQLNQSDEAKAFQKLLKGAKMDEVKTDDK